AFGVLAMMFVIYIVISDIGKIKLGRPEETPEFSDSSWASMLFCGGIGASILYWGNFISLSWLLNISTCACTTWITYRRAAW
ncbi:BCCT family transporter, partial [Cobetia sp. SIMBA_158]|uniref:BCCT family transporter n=1 Tax=Cobetia sp. SIMBA_158 TaxID=3081617 RepID=UPI0039800F33